MFRAASIVAALFAGAYGERELSVDVVTRVTQHWMDAVVLRSDPEEVAGLFCEDGILVATAGVGIRMQNSSENGYGEPKPAGTTIKSYFEWFATLPEQNITRFHHNIAKWDSDVWVNNAWVNWTWEGNPSLVARMTFVVRASASEGVAPCIFELHSSQLPLSPESRRLRGAAALSEVARLSSTDVEQVTSAWMNAVVNKSDSQAVANLFCEDGILVATAGVGLRFQTASEDGWGQPKPEGTTIKSYFDWFATLPEQAVTASHNNIAKITETVWVNNAWVNWVWTGNPDLTARMTFIVHVAPTGACIFELHSSQLPLSQ
jgi:ketosteroid isomerase-like protein